MKYRNPIAVLVLPFITFGIYAFVWCFKTRREMVDNGYDVPTAWLIFIPLLNLYWLWRYSEAAEEITDGANSKVIYFILLVLLGPIGNAIIQNEFNRVPALPAGEDIRITVERIGV